MSHRPQRITRHTARPSADPRLCLATDSAAERLGVGLTTMRALIASGEVESITIGRRRLVLAESLAEYVQKRRREQGRVIR